MTLLADGLGGILIAADLGLGIFVMMIAIVVEIPVLTILCRIRWYWATVFSILINLVSMVIGFLPAMMFAIGYDLDWQVNPWEVYQHPWPPMVEHILVLFVATVIVEWLCLLVLVFSRFKVPIRRMSLSVLTANFVSYIILAGAVVWHMPLDGDFAFVESPDWLREVERRVWFVDPDTCQICSIQVDGSNRRTEVSHPIYSSESWGYDDGVSIYAVVPSEDSLYYADPDRYWHRVHDGEDQRLVYCLDSENSNGDWRYQVGESLRRARQETCDSPVAGTAYYIGRVPKWHMVSRAPCNDYENCEWEAWCSQAWGRSASDAKWIWGFTFTRNTGEVLRFGIPDGFRSVHCREPFYFEEEDLAVIRCGGWLVVLDVKNRKAAPLVKGRNALATTPLFAVEFWE